MTIERTEILLHLLSAAGEEISNKLQLPSFPLAEERVVERSDDRVSRIACQELAVMFARTTHLPQPCWGLVYPLFACGGKRVAAFILFFESLLFLTPGNTHHCVLLNLLK